MNQSCQGQHIPLSKQIDNFRDVKRRLITRLGPEQAALLISKSLHLIVTGSNDFFSYYDSSSISSSTDAGLPPAFEQNLLARFVSQLQVSNLGQFLLTSVLRMESD
jgi:hypothetical protein